jgi:uncharacterized protein YigE (DUF2233 family)
MDTGMLARQMVAVLIKKGKERLPFLKRKAKHGWSFQKFLSASHPVTKSLHMKKIISLLLLLLSLTGLGQAFDSYITTADKISFHYQQNGKNISTLPALAALHPEIRFAMNGQMYAGKRSNNFIPVGLYIENRRQISKLVRVNNPKVNFGMQPQCVFAITNANKALMLPLDAVKTADYKYAVELAPMVVVEGLINPKLTRSDSRYIRNGIGILKDGRVLLAISREPVTFREFAAYFQKQGCTSAAYVDGAVSESWRKATGPQYSGRFAVMIAAR